MRIDLETKFTHDSFELIFEVLVLKGILLEVIFEDGMDKHLIPRDPVALLKLKSHLNKILAFIRQIFINIQRLISNLINQFKLSPSRPGCMSMDHLVEYSPYSPDITL